MSIDRSRLHTDRDFTIIANAYARDRRLTYRARGVLAYLLSHEVGYRVSIAAIVANAPEGRDAVRAAIRELRAAGYLDTVPVRDTETGEFRGQHFVMRDPVLLETRSADKSEHGNSGALKKTNNKNTINQKTNKYTSTAGLPATAAQLEYLSDMADRIADDREVPGDLDRPAADALIREWQPEFQLARFHEAN